MRKEVENMKMINALSLLSYEGRLIINPNDIKADMILAWLFIMKNEKTMPICSYHKLKKSGLWCNVKYVLDRKETDILIASDEKYNSFNIRKYIIDIDSEIRLQQEAIIRLSDKIDENMNNAYNAVDNYSDDYFKSISYLPNMYYRGNNLTNADYKSDYVNIVGSLRYTVQKEDFFDKGLTVHFFGDSRFYGLYVEDKYTIPSIVHNETGLKCINYGVHGTSIFDIKGQIENSGAKAGDIVVINNGFIKSEKNYPLEIVNRAVIDEIVALNELCITKGLMFILCVLPDCGDKKILTEQENRYCLYQELQKVETSNSKYESLDADWTYVIPMLQVQGVCCCDIIPVVENYADTEIFVDYIHFSPNGNRLIAKEITKYIDATVVMKNQGAQIVLNELKDEYKRIINERRGDLTSNFFDNEKFEKFLMSLKGISSGKTSEAVVIVMNANPFTLGHLYILEESSKRFPYVYVLAVQETYTAIPFEDRIELIKKGTKHLNNISIIPSSEFVVSTVTLPEYFNKDKEQMVTVDASRDIRLFVDYVMPALNVSTRVAGEEPYCRVTREYNRQIRDTFEKKGKQFIQIERKKVQDDYISASKVRRALIDGDFDLIKTFVPATTYNYLLKNRDFLVSRIREMEVTK